MATLRQAQQAFVTAFNTWLEQTTPNYLTSTRESFKHLPAKSRDDKGILERIGKPRLFDLNVNKPSLISHDYFGSSTQGFMLEYELHIAYPTAERWFSAMIDDYILIKCNFASDPISASGVAYSKITDDFETVETEDNWLYAKYKVRVMYDVTPS